MKPLSLLLFLIIISTACFCQKQHAFDKAIEKLTYKTWKEYKSCKNDSCYAVFDSSYYYFGDRAHNYYDSKDTVITGYSHYRFMLEPITNTFMFGYETCSPMLVFLDDYQNNNQHCDILIADNEGWQHGELTFPSDSQFVLIRHFLKDSYYDTDFDTKRYYRLVKTPKEILDIEKR